MSKKDIFAKTQKRIITTCIGIVLICLIMFAVITQMTYQSRVYSLVDQQLGTFKNTILTSNDLMKNSGGKIKVVLPPPFTPNIISFVWLEGELVDKSSNNPLKEGTYPTFSAEDKDKMMNMRLEEMMYRGVSFKHEGLTVQLLINIDSEIASVRQLMMSLVISLLILVIIAIFFASYLAFIVIKPIRKAYNQQIYFVQDASHEMRTPLAIIKGTIEMMGRRLDEPMEEHLDELSQMMTEVRGLEKLNSDLLLLSKEDIQMKLQISTFEVQELIEELREFYEELAEFQDKKFEIAIPHEKIQVGWDKIKVKRCMTILLENAFRYTEENDTVKVIVQKNDKCIEIAVQDTGIGIKEEDLKRLFDRFFRSSDVRAKGIDGSGIGLSLLKSLCHTTDSKIEVESIYGKGSIFRLKLPIRMK